jgi:hypothetical protein
LAVVVAVEITEEAVQVLEDIEQMQLIQLMQTS